MWATCDDEITTYIDGVRQQHPNNETWPHFTKFSISDKAQVVAIHCLNKQHGAFIAASFSNGRKTDRTTWKCSSVQENGWMDPDFNDSHWESPKMLR